MAKDKKSGMVEVPEQQRVPEQEPVNIPKQETVNVMFRENRKFDLHVGRDMITFRGRESKPIPKSWLKHSDFIQVKRLFIVKGV